ncbi:MAG: hydrolase [Candidatus Gracilibacteria bacterium]
MADDNTQTTQNTATPAQVTEPQAVPAVEAIPAAPVSSDSVAPAPVEAVPTATPVVAPTPTPEVAPAPVAAPAVPAPVEPAAPAPSTPAAGGMAGLGLGAFKTALDSAKNVATQGQSGMGKLTGTLSSVGGNVMGAVTGTCDCPEVIVENWDKKKVTLHKTFYKTFSPRAFGYHFSDAIDKNRGMIEIKVKDYKTPTKPMILDTNSLFLSTLFIEVEGANSQDPKVVTLEKEFYCKATKNTSRKDLKSDLVALEQEMGKKPTEVYFWFVTCSKCGAEKEIKTIILAA